MLADQLVANRRKPDRPVVSAANPHRLRGVVVAVIVMAVAITDLDLGHELFEIGDAGLNFFGVVHRRAIQRDDARGRTRKRAGPALEHVAKAAIRVLRLLDVADAASTVSLGTYSPRVPRGAQGVDLADRDGEVGIPADGLIAPAPSLFWVSMIRRTDF